MSTEEKIVSAVEKTKMDLKLEIESGNELDLIISIESICMQIDEVFPRNKILSCEKIEKFKAIINKIFKTFILTFTTYKSIGSISFKIINLNCKISHFLISFT
jgi:hypothetical protein